MIRALAIALLLDAVLAFGGYVASAHAATSPQAWMDQTTAWDAATLHAEVLPRAVTLTDGLDQAQWAGQFNAPAGTVDLRPWVAHELSARTVTDSVGRPGMPGYRRFYGAPYLVLHESLHREATAACWGVGQGGIDVEEGATDALTADLYPAWLARFYGVRRGVMTDLSYPREVAMVRAWSARATGSRTWRERAARQWRRGLWSASCDGRAEMIAAAAAGGGR